MRPSGSFSMRMIAATATIEFVSTTTETEALLRTIAAGGELSTLTAERVWQELAKALMEPKPSLFFEALRRCGALGQLLPEVDALFGIPNPPAHRRPLRQ